MKRVLATVTFLLSITASTLAQEIKVSPSAVNAYSQGATTVFLTFTNVINKRPVDSCFCGEVIEATPGLGFKCRPGTEFGCLPVRYNQSRLNANGTYTDIMSVPASVARRAYFDAAGGAEASFYYVRRFVSTIGGPDEFVPVTIRLSGNGAAAPFSITNVKLSWGVDKPVLLVKPDEKLPKIQAELTYTGSGRLTGRWEIIKPGEALPSSRDLLTEGTLPVEERGSQRRYTQLSRFNIFLPPTGKFVLSGPENWRVPSHLEGMYVVLLRIEAVNDASADTFAAGTERVSTGGVAGFQMPTLRYYVGAGTGVINKQNDTEFSPLSPGDGALIQANGLIEFRWSELKDAALYRIEFEDPQGRLFFSATLLPATLAYRAPSWLKDRLADNRLRWRIVALDQSGNVLRETPRRLLRMKM